MKEMFVHLENNLPEDPAFSTTDTLTIFGNIAYVFSSKIIIKKIKVASVRGT